MNDKIRIGLLVDSLKLPAWIVEMIKKINALDAVETVVLITPAIPGKDIAHREKLWSYNFYAKVDRLLYNSFPDPNKLSDISSFIENIPRVNVAVVVSGSKKELSPNDINMISTYKADVFIKLGFEGLCGEILDLPRFGVWSLDCYKESSAPLMPGALQFFNNKGASASSVKKLSDKPGGEKILYQSFSMTDEKSLNRNLNKLYWKSLSFIPRLLSMLAQHDESWFWSHVNKIEPSTALTGPTLSNSKILKTLLNKTWAEFSNRMKAMVDADRWNLYYHIGESDKVETDVTSFKKIPCPKAAFWADPHMVNFHNKTFIFFEEWDHKKNKGHISAIEFNDDGNIPTVLKVLEKPYHLSYPFTFEWNGTYYMIPETAANKTIELYHCTNFPGQWTFVMNLMENIHAVDTTLYFHDNKWWLFANMVENAGASALDELFIFYADDFLTTKWTAHKLNPVVSDSRKARPAGALFLLNNKIYRPSQCSDKIYGRATNINEVTILTETEFSEINIAVLSPGGSDDSKGVHSYSKLGALTVIDKFYSRNHGS